jgi:hypothetical protein
MQNKKFIFLDADLTCTIIDEVAVNVTYYTVQSLILGAKIRRCLHASLRVGFLASAVTLIVYDDMIHSYRSVVDSPCRNFLENPLHPKLH